MKRLISLALVAVMLITAVPFYAALSVFAIDPALENSVKELVGEAPSEPMVKTEFYSDGYVPGGNLTVTITVTPLNEAGIVGYEADSLIYDSSVLTLANSKTSLGAVDCITASPGREWVNENYTTADTDGEVLLSAMGGVQYADQVLTSGKTLEFTLKFNVAEGVSGDLIIYIPHAAVSGAEARTLDTGAGLGGYIVISENTSGDVSDDESEDVSEDISEDISDDVSEDVSDEPYIPSDKEDEVLDLMGDAPSAPLARIEISAPRYIDGEVLEVRISVHDIIDGGLNSMSIEGFTYDHTKLKLLNEINSTGAIECITTCPGSDWTYDNFCKVEGDGVLTLASMGGLLDESQLLMPGKSLVFTLRFAVLEGTTEELVFYAPHEGVLASKANDIYPLPCEGDYLIVHHKCALGHTAGAEADCENDQVCTVCGDVLTPALGHDYDSVVTAPDCENGGYTTYTCANCGDTYVDSETEALGHTAGAEAGCENDQVCTVCGDVLTPALGHDYDSVVTAPDCENGGYTTHTCANCGDSYIDSEVDSLGHDYDSVVTAPDCENGGYTTHTCANCGDTYVDSETEALGHTAGAEADCENDQVCTVCGDVLTPALGHDYDSVVTAPDCENGGYTTHTCANCGDSYIDSEVDSLGHDYNAVVTAPDCENGGYTTHTCANCGDTYVDSETEALGHGEGEWITLENNDKELRCEHCGTVLGIDLWGDVNYDGKVNMFDYAIIKAIYFGRQDADGETKNRADINGDGKINMFDYIAVKERVLKK